MSKNHMTSLKTNIVVIYCGKKLPKYVIENIKWLKRGFPDQRLYFISDNEKSLSKVGKLGAQTWKAPPISEEIVARLKESTYSPKFRGGFWVSTLSRFFLLADFAQEMKLDCLLQVEADVLLMRNFPFEKILEISQDLAFPITQENIGVPSTLYLRDQVSAKFLADFTRKCVVDGMALSDVEVLGLLAKEKPEKVFILPSAFFDDLNFNVSANTSVRTQMTANLEVIPGIFDGSTWGQYLTGDDPANNYGVSNILHNQPHQGVNPTQVKFNFGKDGFLIASLGDEVREIYSLHIHSKNKSLFRLQLVNSGRNIEFLDFKTKRKKLYFLRILTKEAFRRIVKKIGRIIRSMILIETST